MNRWLEDDDGLSLSEFVAETLDRLAVPFAAACRFSNAGLTRHMEWRQVWDQRSEDRGETRDSVNAPPRYEPADFAAASFFALRGKLDVPKERFISYPGCESDEDGGPATAGPAGTTCSGHRRWPRCTRSARPTKAWTADRLTPMLAGLLEVLPWLKQWHNEPDAEFGGLKMGEYFAQFLDGECQTLGLTDADLEAWRPTKKAKKSVRTPEPDVRHSEGERGPRKKKAAAAEPREADS